MPDHGRAVTVGVHQHNAHKTATGSSNPRPLHTGRGGNRYPGTGDPRTAHASEATGYAGKGAQGEAPRHRNVVRNVSAAINNNNTRWMGENPLQQPHTAETVVQRWTPQPGPNNNTPDILQLYRKYISHYTRPNQYHAQRSPYERRLSYSIPNPIKPQPPPGYHQKAYRRKVQGKNTGTKIY